MTKLKVQRKFKEQITKEKEEEWNDGTKFSFQS